MEEISQCFMAMQIFFPQTRLRTAVSSLSSGREEKSDFRSAGTRIKFRAVENARARARIYNAMQCNASARVAREPRFMEREKENIAA